MGLLVSMLSSADGAEASKGLTAVASTVRNLREAQESFLASGKAATGAGDAGHGGARRMLTQDAALLTKSCPPLWQGGWTVFRSSCGGLCRRGTQSWPLGAANLRRISWRQARTFCRGSCRCVLPGMWSAAVQQ